MNVIFKMMLEFSHRSYFLVMFRLFLVIPMDFIFAFAFAFAFIFRPWNIYIQTCVMLDGKFNVFILYNRRSKSSEKKEKMRVTSDWRLIFFPIFFFPSWFCFNFFLSVYINVNVNSNCLSIYDAIKSKNNHFAAPVWIRTGEK